VEENHGSSHRFRSWEHCRNAFLNARNKPLDDALLDTLALHLAFYLASWGMYRGSSFLLSLDYTVHKKIVEIVMKDEYSLLFDSDRLIVEKPQEYLDLLFGNSEKNGIVKEINAWYVKWHNEVLSSPIDDLDEMAETNAKEKKDVSTVLITKVLMGVYGCVPAYDRYVMDGLKTQGINATFGRRAVEALLKAVVKKDAVYNNILFARNGIVKEENKKYTALPPENYTFMKVVDMLFWEMGAGHVVYVEKTKERESTTVENLENMIFENRTEGPHDFVIKGKKFSSQDIGSLIMCVYDELKIKGDRKKEIKKHIEEKLEQDWQATTRYSKKIVR
jgi:hypothetical protein